MSKFEELATAYAKRRYDPEGGEYHWNMASAETREAEIQDAKAYIREMLSVFPDVGLKAVPVEATERMQINGQDMILKLNIWDTRPIFLTGRVYAFMISEAPNLLTEEDNG